MRQEAKEMIFVLAALAVLGAIAFVLVTVLTEPSPEEKANQAIDTWHKEMKKHNYGVE